MNPQPVLYSTYLPLHNAYERFDIGGYMKAAVRLRCFMLKRLRVTLVPEQRLRNYHIIAA